MEKLTILQISLKTSSLQIGLMTSNHHRHKMHLLPYLCLHTIDEDDDRQEAMSPVLRHLYHQMCSCNS